MIKFTQQIKYNDIIISKTNSFILQFLPPGSGSHTSKGNLFVMSVVKFWISLSKLGNKIITNIKLRRLDNILYKKLFHVHTHILN